MPEFQFKGKEAVRNHHLSVPFRPLEPDAKKSISDTPPPLDGNLIIHGDNLHALKSLIPMYAGKVKCIYIDPPYNTGNEGWCYNDNVSDPRLQKWLDQTSIDIEDGLRHDKWCCMMWPRLRLLHELLSYDGAIFISIDENEHHHLRMMMDEIFGEKNFVSNIIWESNKNIMKGSNYIRRDHEYVLMYQKGNLEKIRMENEDLNFQNPDNDPRGPWLNTNATVTSGGHSFAIQLPSGKEVIRNWRFTKEEYESGEIPLYFKDDNVPRLKRYKNEYNTCTKMQASILFDLATTTTAKNSLAEIFECKASEIPFDYPKPHELIKHLLGLVSSSDDIILDSFAGSGTTAHAVLAQNGTDGGQRKFIIVECEDYADSITAERVRRVIEGVPTATRDEQIKEGLGGEFTFCTLGNFTKLDELLSGVELPTYENLATELFYIATNETIEVKLIDKDAYYVGESLDYHVWLIYKPDMEFLISDESALTLELAGQMSSSKILGKKHLVFAPHKFVSDKRLREESIPVEYQPLPWLIGHQQNEL